MKITRPVRARLTMMWGKQQMPLSAAMVPIVAPGFSQDCRYCQPSPAFLKPSNQVAMRRQFALTLDIAKVSLQEIPYISEKRIQIYAWWSRACMFILEHAHLW